MSTFERINSLDPDTGLRLVGEEFIAVGPDEHPLRVSDKELAKLKKWGGLEGDPSFLGHGTKGAAYKFNDKVLKLTNDSSEAEAVNLIAGKHHPNVYSVHGVALRDPEDRQDASQHPPYAIVYDFLDYPTKDMLEPTRYLFSAIKGGSARDRFYNWPTNSLKRSREMFQELEDAVRKDPSILGEPLGKWDRVGPKIEEIGEKLGWSSDDMMAFNALYTEGLEGSMRSRDIENADAIASYADKTSDDVRRAYLHQLASGLTHLKKHGITFDDLKVSNIMEKDGQAVIIDVGYSTVDSRFKKPISSISEQLSSQEPFDDFEEWVSGREISHPLPKGHPQRKEDHIGYSRLKDMLKSPHADVRHSAERGIQYLRQQYGMHRGQKVASSVQNVAFQWLRRCL